MRDTVDPIVDSERAPDIGFLIPEVKSRLGSFGSNLWNALNRLRRPSPDQDLDKTFFYLGALPDTSGGVVTSGDSRTINILTHRFVLDIPVDKYWDIVSLTMTLLEAPTSKCELRIKRKPRNIDAYESILDESNIFVVQDEFVGSRFDLLVSEFFNGDEIQIDCISNGGASNVQIFFRGKLRTKNG